MPKMPFTQRNIDRLPRAEKRTNYQDTQVRNLYLRVSPTGLKTFIYKRHFRGKSRWVTIGRYPEMPLDEARTKAHKLAYEISQGYTIDFTDPRSVTLGETLKDYLEKRELKAKTKDNYISCIEGTLEDWCNFPLHKINRKMVSDRYNTIAKSTVSRANNTFRVLRTLFNFACAQYRDTLDRPLYPDNPVLVLTESRQWRKTPRKKTWVKHLNDWHKRIAKCPVDVRDYYYVLLLTGLRGETVGDLRNEPEILDHRGEQAPYYNAEEQSIVWFNKNNDIAEVPVTDTVATIIERQPVTNGRYFSTINRARRERALDAVGLTHSRHDLRRTFLTVGESLDIQATTLKRLVGHRTHENDVTTGYIMADMERLRSASEQITAALSNNFTSNVKVTDSKIDTN